MVMVGREAVDYNFKRKKRSESILSGVNNGRLLPKRHKIYRKKLLISVFGQSPLFFNFGELYDKRIVVAFI